MEPALPPNDPAKPKGPNSVMKSVDRALSILRHFTVVQPELGLTEVTRQTELEKATVHRILTALTRNGLLEQSSASKKYRLGAEVLRLARVREASVPLSTIVQPVLERLCQQSGETTHGTLGAKEGMLTIGISEPPRSTRVFVDAAAILPFHATASGLVYSAFARDEAWENILEIVDFSGFTPSTITSEARFLEMLGTIRKTGFAVAHGTFEVDTTGVASAFFDAGDRVCGTVAVAGVASRMDEGQVRRASQLVIAAANDITQRLGGARVLP